MAHKFPQMKLLLVIKSPNFCVKFCFLFVVLLQDRTCTIYYFQYGHHLPYLFVINNVFIISRVPIKMTPFDKMQLFIIEVAKATVT